MSPTFLTLTSLGWFVWKWSPPNVNSMENIVLYYNYNQPLNFKRVCFPKNQTDACCIAAFWGPVPAPQ